MAPVDWNDVGGGDHRAAPARAGVNRQSLKVRCGYRIGLFLAAALAGAGYFGARLEGADFLRPS
jgi:hypothetical protein